MDLQLHTTARVKAPATPPPFFCAFFHLSIPSVTLLQLFKVHQREGLRKGGMEAILRYIHSNNYPPLRQTSLPQSSAIMLAAIKQFRCNCINNLNTAMCLPMANLIISLHFLIEILHLGFSLSGLQWQRFLDIYL